MSLIFGILVFGALLAAVFGRRVGAIFVTGAGMLVMTGVGLYSGPLCQDSGLGFFKV